MCAVSIAELARALRVLFYSASMPAASVAARANALASASFWASILAQVGSRSSILAFLASMAALSPAPAARPFAPAPRRLFGKGGEGKPGGGGGMAGMQAAMENMKKAQEIQKKTKDMQDELEKAEVECVAADGKVKVVLNGQQVPQRVEIDVEGMDASVTAALMTEKMQSIYADLGGNLPKPTA